MPLKKLTLTIPKEVRRPKSRSGVKQSRVHKSKKVYRRKPKHRKNET